MSWFDAVCHSFSTVAIGGFSTHDASIGYFNNPAIMLVCCYFMAVSAVNFAMHFFCWRQRSLLHYVKDPEFLFFISILLFAITVVSATLIYTDTYQLNEGLLHGTFQAISIATTTGFATASFAHWPLMLQTIWIFAITPVCRSTTRLHVSCIPGFGADCSQKSAGVEGSCTNFHIQGLLYEATLVRPIMLQSQDEALKSFYIKFWFCYHRVTPSDKISPILSWLT